MFTEGSPTLAQMVIILSIEFHRFALASVQIFPGSSNHYMDMWVIGILVNNAVPVELVALPLFQVSHDLPCPLTVVKHRLILSWRKNELMIIDTGTGMSH